jgi:hypothetical protein
MPVAQDCAGVNTVYSRAESVLMFVLKDYFSPKSFAALREHSFICTLFNDAFFSNRPYSVE